MIEIGRTPEAQLIEFVRSWFALLARGAWEEALTLVDEPNTYGIRWTRESIGDLLQETFGPGTRFAMERGTPTFTDPGLAKGTPRHTFGKFDDGGFWLDHDVPVNGIYSDLTAQFEFLPRPEGFAVRLQDLHVL